MTVALDPTRTVRSGILRWGILGAGGIAATVGADIAASPGSQIVAVAARDAGRAARFAAERAIPRSYGTYAELAADPDVDVVYLATTHAQHHEQALMCLEAGKPLLIEKAFALNARQAREIVAAARQRELFCMEAMWMRLNPLIIRVQQLVAAGRIGGVLAVRADLSKHFAYDPAHRLYDPVAGGGALLDLGVYPATFAWLMLGRPDTVVATGQLAPTGVDLTVAQQWGYADGRCAQVFCTAAAGSPYTGLVNGSDGWIHLDGRLHHPASITVHSGGEEEVIYGDPADNGYGPEIAEVERCLRAGLVESPRVPLDDTVAILELLDGVRAQLGVRYPADTAGD